MTFTRRFAEALALKVKAEGYRMIVCLGIREDEDDDIDVVVAGAGGLDDIDDLEDVLAQLKDEMRGNIAFQEPQGSA